jgi:Tol biopolymer transport system component
MARTAWRAVGVLVIAAALRPAGAEPGSFLTAPQRDPQLGSFAPPSVDVSADGRYVAFESYARLVTADTNDHRDVYVLDLETKRVTLESETAGVQGDAAHPRLSGDGRFVVFESSPAQPDDVPTRTRIVLVDRVNATATVVSRRPGGEAADGPSRDPDISGDGTVVVFTSSATNLVEGVDANGREEDVYAFDVLGRTLQRVSVTAAGAQPAGSSTSPSVSGDGRLVAFASSPAPQAVALGRGRSSPRRDPKLVLVRDLVARTTVTVSTASRGAPPDGDSWGPAISRDGRFVAFVSEATNLGGGGRNHAADVFLRVLGSGSLRLVSRTPEGGDANGTSVSPAISADGRFVAFQSDASNLVCARRCAAEDQDINLLADVFLLDRERATMTRVSGDDSGGWMEASRGPALDASGRVVAFSSRHPTDRLDEGDDFDLFVQVASGPGGEPESWGRAFPAPPDP